MPIIFHGSVITCRTEVGKLAGERAALLKKLVEVEMDGKAAGEQMIKLRDTVRRLKEVNKQARGLVSKETVVLHRWRRETQFGIYQLSR